MYNHDNAGDKSFETDFTYVDDIKVSFYWEKIKPDRKATVITESASDFDLLVGLMNHLVNESTS